MKTLTEVVVMALESNQKMETWLRTSQAGSTCSFIHLSSPFQVINDSTEYFPISTPYHGSMDRQTVRETIVALISESWGSCFLIFWYQVAIFEVNQGEFAVRFVLNRLFRFQCCQVSDSTFQNHFLPFHEIEELASGFFNGSLWLIFISHII